MRVAACAHARPRIVAQRRRERRDASARFQACAEPKRQLLAKCLGIFSSICGLLVRGASQSPCRDRVGLSIATAGSIWPPGAIRQ
jgi:hypothetical protein